MAIFLESHPRKKTCDNNHYANDPERKKPYKRDRYQGNPEPKRIAQHQASR